MPTKGRILCVEDDSDTCSMLTYLLEQEGYEVRTVESVEESLGLARQSSFNLYILDNWLSEGSGTALCRKIREFDPHTSIIFYSGAAFESDRAEALHAGANAFVAKPYFDQLIETVKRLLDF